MCPSEQIFCPRKMTLPAQRCLAGARREPPSAVLILFYSGEKKPVFADRFLKMVGERGFEPPTHWSQTSCATKLRYSPIFYFVLPGAKRGT